MSAPLDFLYLRPRSTPSHGDPWPLARQPLDRIGQDALAVELERGVTTQPHPLDDGYSREGILLGVQPPHPDDLERLVDRQGAGSLRRPEVAEGIRDIGRCDAVSGLRPGDAGSRERDGQRQARRRPGYQPLEDGTQKPVVEERAFRERRTRAVEHEEHPLAAKSRDERGQRGQEVASAVDDDHIGLADLAPEPPPAPDGERPAPGWQEPGRHQGVGVD
ncbi:MAG: hypothetical protein E6G25_03685 [Actinobacteria bacterium]|nr:MAG: hypothetical protein E6G25_03685 [Actinomycetota bacterium]